MGFLLDANCSWSPQETIKILNSDESLDLFRKRSTSLIQLSSGREKVRPQLTVCRTAVALSQVRREALRLLRGASAKSENPELNFLALALSGRKAGHRS